MTAVIIVSFLIIFAFVLMAIGVGAKFVEAQRKKSVTQMLHTVEGKTAEVRQVRILTERGQQGEFEQWLKNLDLSRGLATRIQQAGLDWNPAGLMFMMAAGAVIGFLLGSRIPVVVFTWTSELALALLFGFAPYIYLAQQRKKRLGEIEEQLPEALDFLARSMRAGHAFTISLEMSGVETPDPLGHEFRTVFNEHNLGASIESALANLAKRVPLLDIRIFVSSVLLQKQTGGNLSEILMRLAYIIRERFRLKGQVKAASAHGRLTALVLTLLPVVVLFALMVIAPDYLKGMADDPDGKWLIVAAITGQVLGYFVMRRIINIKV